jgi:hypothetical protein
MISVAVDLGESIENAGLDPTPHTWRYLLCFWGCTRQGITESNTTLRHFILFCVFADFFSIVEN